MNLEHTLKTWCDFVAQFCLLDVVIYCNIMTFLIRDIAHIRSRPTEREEFPPICTTWLPNAHSFSENIPASFKSSVLARNLSRKRHYAASREKDFSHFTTTDWHKAWRRDIHHRTHRRTIPFAQVFFHVKIQHGGASCLSNNLVKSWFVSIRMHCCCYFFNIYNYFDLFVGALCGNWWSRVRLQSFHSTHTSG